MQALGRHQDALGDYAKAIALAKDYVDAHFNEALALLTVGDYARGFAEYEWRWKRAGIARRNLGKPLWLGEYPLGRKTILLHAEQGLGDTIQFARYAPLLAQGGATVLLEVQAELKDLLSGLDGVRVFARGETLPAFDVHCPLGSLPLAFKTTLASVPAGDSLSARERGAHRRRGGRGSTRCRASASRSPGPATRTTSTIATARSRSRGCGRCCRRPASASSASSATCRRAIARRSPG